MGRHRVRRDGERAAPPVRPRMRRIGAAGSSVLITAVAVLGGMGLLPSGSGSGAVYAADVSAGVPPAGAVARLAGVTTSLPIEPRLPRTGPSDSFPLPEDSGTGRRIVFDMSAQRVWLVGSRHGDDVVRRTYLVSGSVTDNLQPGSYAVYSKSLHAWGIDDSGTMKYMVRFAHGDNAAIGFHDIPVDDGHRVQTRAELGTPRSHGCIRQWRPDAKALWRFAPVGTTVVVTA